MVYGKYITIACFRCCRVENYAFWHFLASGNFNQETKKDMRIKTPLGIKDPKHEITEELGMQELENTG